MPSDRKRDWTRASWVSALPLKILMKRDLGAVGGGELVHVAIAWMTVVRPFSPILVWVRRPDGFEHCKIHQGFAAVQYEFLERPRMLRPSRQVVLAEMVKEPPKALLLDLRDGPVVHQIGLSQRLEPALEARIGDSLACVAAFLEVPDTLGIQI